MKVQTFINGSDYHGGIWNLSNYILLHHGLICNFVCQLCSFRLHVSTLPATIFTRLYLGGPDQICSHCGPHFWYEERVRGHGRTTSPVYNRCCRGGSIVLPPYSKPPAPLLALLTGKDSTLYVLIFHLLLSCRKLFSFWNCLQHIDFIMLG